MGSVFQARHLLLQRDVALKTLPRELSRHSDHVARFHREVQRYASRRSPVKSLDLSPVGIKLLTETPTESCASGQFLNEESFGRFHDFWS